MISKMKRHVALMAVAATLLGTSAQAEDNLKVGSTPTGVPFTFLDVKTNEIQGVMVDIITAVGEAEGFTPEVEATQWSALIPSLTGEKIDIIAAAMYATEKRAEIVSFSDPVYSYGEGMFLSEDNFGKYTTWDDLKGKVVGAQVGTAYVDGLKADGEFEDVRVYDNMIDIMRDVSLGRIDAGFGDRPLVAYQLSKGASDVQLVEEYKSRMMGDVAIAVRQDDNELLARINSGLAKISESGELDQIIAKWGIE